MKHKHSELIKAWADGAEIEYYDLIEKKWCLIMNPSWKSDLDYRVKEYYRTWWLLEGPDGRLFPVRPSTEAYADHCMKVFPNLYIKKHKYTEPE